MPLTVHHVPGARPAWRLGDLGAPRADGVAHEGEAAGTDDARVLEELDEMEEMAFAILQQKARERMGL